MMLVTYSDTRGEWLLQATWVGGGTVAGTTICTGPMAYRDTQGKLTKGGVAGAERGNPVYGSSWIR